MENDNNKNDEVSFNMDEFEDFDFKVVNKGLGFHNDRYDKVVRPIVNREKIPEKYKELGSIHNFNINNESLGMKRPTGLDAFYTDSVCEVVEVDSITEEMTSLKETCLATKVGQSMAFLIDLIVLSFATFITFSLFVAVSGLSMREFSLLLTSNERITFGMITFSLFYLLYFTTMDLTSSVGKSILGIRLVKFDLQQVSVTDTLIRSIITLLSFTTIGLPSLLDFQGKLSDTKLVQK